MNQLSTRIALAALTALFAVTGAQAAQKTTSRCSVTGPGGNVLSHTFGLPPVSLTDVGITVNNTTSANKTAYIQLSADAGVGTASEMRMTFSVDGAAGTYYGPQNFANHTEFWQTRSTTAMISVPPGVHQIVPQFFVQGPAGASGVIDDRCMTVTF